LSTEKQPRALALAAQADAVKGSRRPMLGCHPIIIDDLWRSCRLRVLEAAGITFVLRGEQRTPLTRQAILIGISIGNGYRHVSPVGEIA